MLKQSGEATVTYGDGHEESVPVFQCDECVMIVDFAGEEAEVALTFALDEQGHPFDPADPDRELRF